jgi:CRISPR/Cas system-associated exonuclease Cas4 (RecB family)
VRTFLNRVAEKIIKDKINGPESIVILPNRRSEVFLKKEIKSINDSEIWLPDFFPIDVFIQRISELKKADNISLALDLFEIYGKLEGDDAKSLDEFLTWTPVIFNDFNDIDNAMADAKTLYEDLSSVKAIEQWSPGEEKLTQLQQKYLRFFNSMYKYYTSLRESMISKGCGYQGFINRYLAENIQEKNIPWRKFLIVGINALTESEIMIFKYLNDNFNVEFLWDIDDYYFNDSNNKINNEAGKYIRYNIDRLKLKTPDKIYNYLRNESKRIRIIGVPKNIGQVKFIGQELLNSNSINNSNTAIVLSDERLIVPLIHSLPNYDNNKYNVTLGYPLSNSPAELFISSLFDVLESQQGSKTKLETSVLLNLLSNSITKLLLGNKLCNKWINNLADVGNYYVKIEDVQSISDQLKNRNQNILSIVLLTFKKGDLGYFLNQLKNLLIDCVNDIFSSNILVREEVQSLITIIIKVEGLITSYKDVGQYQTLKKIIKQLFMLSNINLIGEPLAGTQIMGMLETRTLDFENIYILSVNEGVLPKTSSIDSFIPFDIRREQKLPLPSYKSGVYAYHFYRLLQRSKNITLLYSTDSDKLGGGEKSRFIQQIENELSLANTNITLSNEMLTSNINNNGKDLSEIVIKKNTVIQAKITELSEIGYSASSLISYITCPLKFYFQYILRVDSKSPLEKNIEANTFGLAIHGVLDNIYKLFKGSKVDQNKLAGYVGNTSKMLSEEFEKLNPGTVLNSGKNLLLLEVAKSYIDRFLLWDKNNQQQHPSLIESTEGKHITKLPKDSNVNIKGYIDRVDFDLSSGKTRIIDYKTGVVMPNELKVKNVDDLFMDPKYSKAFQITYYAWIYSILNTDKDIEAGIISMRKISNGFMSLQLTEYDDLKDYFDEFGESVYELISEIGDPTKDFIQTTEKNRCEYCNFKSICNR